VASQSFGANFLVKGDVKNLPVCNFSQASVKENMNTQFALASMSRVHSCRQFRSAIYPCPLQLPASGSVTSELGENSATETLG
jgi:hypothetical protein